MEWFIAILKKPRGVSTWYNDNEEAFEATTRQNIANRSD